MKYITDTLKYLKSNLLLLPSLAVAIIACAPVVDYGAVENIVNSYSDGQITASFADWFMAFMPYNSRNWLSVVLSIVGYIALVMDIAFIHSMVDKHIRFGSKSFRSIMSSYSINFIYGLIAMVAGMCAMLVLALLMALVMTAFSMLPSFAFIAGLVLCAALALLLAFIAAHFFLWLPCVEITGYKITEAVYSSYAQAKTIRWRNFAAIVVPMIIATAITSLVGGFCGPVATGAAGAVCFGCAFMVISVASYMAYADAEGLEREDLKKF